MVGFLSLLFAKKGMFFVIFHPKLAKKWQKSHPNQENLNSSSLMFDNLFRKKDKNCQSNSGKDTQVVLLQCCSSFLGYTHPLSGRENSEFFLLKCFGLVDFSLFSLQKRDIFRNFTPEILKIMYGNT